MEVLTLYEIINAVGGSFGYNEASLVTSVCTDSRNISEGCVFIALKGENFDGHDFAAMAMEKGAVACITERAVEGAKCIIVDSTSKALLDLAAYYRERFKIILAGITGSVGKTTTKEMTALVLSEKYNTLKTSGNLNNEIGLPKTLFGLCEKNEAAVIEMGMSHFGEISRLSLTAKPTIAAITNIGFSHIQNLGSQENILKAKLEILDGMTSDAPLILNGDDKLLCEAGKKLERRVILYGINNKDVDVYADDIASSDNTTTFSVNYWGKSIKAKIGCIGIHNVYDALAAFCIGISSGVEAKECVAGLSRFVPEGMRQRIETKGENTVITDCYNASPDSMKASLTTLSEMIPKQGGKRIAVLGDMLELGEMSEILHSKVGGYVKDSDVSALICIGDKARFIKENCGLINSYFFEDREAASAFIKGFIKPNDIVLFKASRGMKFEEIINKIFD